VTEVLVALASLYVFFFQLPAQFSVSSQALLKRSDPFSTQFTLTNDGLFDAHDVKAECQTAMTDIRNNKFKDNVAEGNVALRVPARDQLTIPCFIGTTSDYPLKLADITLRLSY